ncbi:hypothetical protein [Roseibium aggregatum]|uniref:Uncharacterized protein n=1 Tax=Roseibium aggregatum TaxID=187304 RepID=A0A939EF37_9HYPH|nr:hypothetical protein [Roseibium aggregatum]MBN9670404.1 hypothetical protein [Roseibium aggregatum]
MARFPYYRKNLRDLGELLARAAMDEGLRKEFQSDPKRFLSAIGLPAKTTELLRFTVVDEKETPGAVALPFRLNDAKLGASDDAYLSSLSSMFVRPRLN